MLQPPNWQAEYRILYATDFDERRRIHTCTLQTPHSQISVKLVQTVLRYEFFHLYILQNLKRDFLKGTIFKICTLFNRFRWTLQDQYMYTSKVSQPNFNHVGVRSAETWIFFIVISFKNVWFSQSTFFKISTMCWFFRFYPAICLVFFWNMLIWMPTSQICGKLKIHFSSIGNLFLEHITYMV